MLRELRERGGDVAELNGLAHAGSPALQAKLKALGYSKLGDRAQVIKLLKEGSSESAAASTVPAAVAKERAEPIIFDAFDVAGDGGLMKTTLRLGHVESGRPPIPSCVKVWICPIALHRIASHRIASHRIPSHPIPSHPIPSHSIASHLIPSHPILSHPISSHLIPSHPIQSNPILHHPIPCNPIQTSARTYLTPS